MKPPMTPKIATWCVYKSLNFPKFPIHGFQTHRLLETLKHEVYSQKSLQNQPFHAHKTAKTAHETANNAQIRHVWV